MNNSTEQILMNETAAIPKVQRISTILYLIAGFSLIWTIGANLFIIACFFRNRRRKWTSFTRQTCSMTVSDLLNGLVAIPFLAIDLSGGRTYGVVCHATFYLIFSMQCVTLYHVLGVCIFRNINLITFVEPRRMSSQFTYAICVILVSWIVPCLVILVPFVLWGQYTRSLMDCSIETMFKPKVVQTIWVIAFSYFVSQCLTNVIYVITCCRLMLNIRKIVPIKTDSNGTVNTTLASQTPYQASTGTSRRNNVNTATTTGPSRQSTNTLTMQKRVLVTLGILLLMFNVFTLPVTAFLFFGESLKTSGNVRLIVGILFVINSGLNPIVYATRISSLREAAKKIVREICNALRFK